MLIAQLSDTHVCAPGALSNGVVDTNPWLRRAVAQLAGLAPRPDAVLITGDLADTGRAEEYAELRKMLAPLSMPVYVIPGNHDDRALLRAAFSDHAYLPRDGRFVQYVVDHFPLRLIGLDTVIPGQPGGLLCEERLAWLKARLEEAPDKPSVVFMHHPPFPTGMSADHNGCRNGAALGALIADHPRVERVLCGHFHRPVQMRWYGTIASICPSTAHQLVLNLDAGAQAQFTLEPPAFQLHLWLEGAGLEGTGRQGAGLISHQSAIGEFPGPYPFHHGA